VSSCLIGLEQNYDIMYRNTDEVRMKARLRMRSKRASQRGLKRSNVGPENNAASPTLASWMWSAPTPPVAVPFCTTNGSLDVYPIRDCNWQEGVGEVNEDDRGRCDEIEDNETIADQNEVAQLLGLC